MRPVLFNWACDLSRVEVEFGSRCGFRSWAVISSKKRDNREKTTMRKSSYHRLGAVAALCIAPALAPAPASAAWEPTRPVEFIVPAGTGGGADQMARTIQGIITKHKLMKPSMVVINKSG